jgi:hypothetical protein
MNQSADMPASILTEWGEVIWKALRKGRDFEHGALGRCTTSWATAEAMLRGRVPVGRCEGCMDLVTDALARAWDRREKVSAARNPHGFLAQLARNRWKDLIRKQNTARQGVSCPERLDERHSGRVAAELADPWLVQLLQLMLQDACSRGPVPASGWALDRFAEEKDKFLKVTGQQTGSPDPSVVREDIATVLEVARNVAGSDWVHDSFDAPRLLRRSEHTPLRVGAVFDEDEGTTVDIPSPDSDGGEPLKALTIGFFAALRQGCSAIDAAEMAATRLMAEAAHELPMEVLTDVVVEWLADLLVIEKGRNHQWTPQGVTTYLTERFGPQTVDASLARRISRKLQPPTAKRRGSA